MKKDITYKYEPVNITATKLRENLFTTLYNVQSKNETVVVQKGGVPIAYIVSPETYTYSDFEKKKELEKAEFQKILDDTRGILAYDPDFEKDLKRKRRIEIAASKRRHNAW